MREPAPDDRGGFAALIDVATAVEGGHATAVDAILRRTPTGVLLRSAARHRCLGYVRRSIVDSKIRSEPARAIVAALREYAARAAVQSYATRGQLFRMVGILDRAAISFALLKGAARLFRGDREAEDTAMYDLDLLVPEADGLRALEALQGEGYRPRAAGNAQRYWPRHHHLVPLEPPEAGLPVELHLQLAPQAMLSMATDWKAFERYCEPLERDGARALAFNAVGTALHLTIHGAGVKRLHDAIVLARILASDPTMLGRLNEEFDGERWQPIPLRATLAVAASIAGVSYDLSPAVARYLVWMRRREDLAPYVRERSQFADAWYGNGGKLFGAATRLALPDRDTDDNPVTASARFAYRLVGRIVTSAVAVAASR